MVAVDEDGKGFESLKRSLLQFFELFASFKWREKLDLEIPKSSRRPSSAPVASARVASARNSTERFEQDSFREALPIPPGYTVYVKAS